MMTTDRIRALFVAACLVPAGGLAVLGGCAASGQTASSRAASSQAASSQAAPATVLDDEVSVAPGINDSWMSEEIDPLIGRLEVESREIYAERHAIAALVGPRPGDEVADIGAGSGFMALIFADLVGPEGTVYAVDINPVMMDKVAADAARAGVSNLETVVCGTRSVDLPPASVDVVFVCDTYHHFEYPRHTLRSIHEALRPGGQLFVVDFHRIEGESPEWLLNHVRAGEEVFTAEIEAAGFRLVNDHDMPFLEQNYALRFFRP